MWLGGMESYVTHDRGTILTDGEKEGRRSTRMASRKKRHGSWARLSEKQKGCVWKAEGEREREQGGRCSVCQEFKEAGEKQQKDEAGTAGKGSKEGLAKNPDLILKALEALTGFKQKNDTIN